MVFASICGSSDQIGLANSEQRAPSNLADTSKSGQKAKNKAQPVPEADS